MNKKNTDQPIFFIDRALGKNLVKILRNAGANAEAHIDHFAPNSPDVEWLPEVSRRGWIVLTKDANLGRTPSEQIAIASSSARVFVLAIGDASGEEMAQTFIQALDSIKRFIKGNQAPFIAKVYQNSRVTIWQNHTKLLKMLQRSNEL